VVIRNGVSFVFWVCLIQDLYNWVLVISGFSPQFQLEGSFFPTGIGFGGWKIAYFSSSVRVCETELSASGFGFGGLFHVVFRWVLVVGVLF